jgi:hypothetical protein
MEGVARAEHDGGTDHGGARKCPPDRFFSLAAAANVGRCRLRVRSDLGEVGNSFHVGLACKSRQPFCGLHMDREKGVASALDVQADGVHDGNGIADRRQNGSIVIDVGLHRFDVRRASRKEHRLRSGCRDAIRTVKLASRRWRTMRRPRKPVPPNTAASMRSPSIGLRYLPRARVRAAFFAAAERTAEPFVRTALRAAAERSEGARRAAARAA